MRLNAQQIAGYAVAAGFPPDQIATATAVALAESGGDTNATNKNSNGSVDYGLWQINTVHGSLLNQGDKFNPLDNAKMALRVYAGAGNKWTPWTVYNTGSYRAQMSVASLAAGNPTTPQDAPVTTPDASATPASSASAIPGFGTLGLLSQAMGMLDKLVSGGLWLRVGGFIIGSCLVVFSLFRLSGAESVVMPAVKTAAKVALK